MKSVRIWFVLSAPLLLAVIGLFGSAGRVAGLGVQAYSYVRGSAYLVPESACLGESVLLTGQGQEISVQLSAYMTLDQDSQSYFVFLGNTMTDPAGNWMLPFAVPEAVIQQADGAIVTTPAGSWLVTATSVGQDAYGSSVPLEITGACTVSPSETGTDTSADGATVTTAQANQNTSTTTPADAASPADDASSQDGGDTSGSATPQSARGTVLGVSTLPNTGFPLTQAGIPAAMLVLGGSALRLVRRNRNLNKR